MWLYLWCGVYSCTERGVLGSGSAEFDSNVP
ncbi:hypothetical protein Hamer_G015618 [Homarus americanus]|uniref:Uncharacterized protein n=1 Tax=Homarus americanus TaxID=6706 RepID=A0A8J5JKX6_HOMAM|nr:hypothetical protein Hamer_G015618 [Homarus americanus]